MGKDADRRKTKIDWKTYNKKLVNRGVQLANAVLVLQAVDQDNELKTMNKGKVGRQFVYSDSVVMLLFILKTIIGKGYRDLEGLGKLFLGSSPNFRTIHDRLKLFPRETIALMNRRITKAVTSGAKTIDIVLDATGISLNNKHVWIDEKFKVRRKREWKKLHIVVDVQTRMILHTEVLEKHQHEGKHKRFRKALEGTLENSAAPIDKTYADGAYDSNNNFGVCDDTDIEFVTRVRKQTVRHARVLMTSTATTAGKRKRFLANARNRAALEQTDWNTFVENKRYGIRGCIEGVIGSFKSFFGESAFSKKAELVVKEAASKRFVWNSMQQP